VRSAVAGALTAGALLLVPVGAVVIATPGIAHADLPGGGSGGPGTGGTGGPGTGGGSTTTTKRIIKLPGLKIEVKNTTGDHRAPTIKFVPFPNLHRSVTTG
jgi:hypothetical protein